MLEDLRALDKWFDRAEWPAVTCPTCRHGMLAPAPDLHRDIPTAASERAMDDEGWEPDRAWGYFQSVQRCGSSDCGEIVLTTGEFRVEPLSFTTSLRLRNAQPPFALMDLPENCPERVRNRVRAASAVLWTDAGAAGNRLRAAIEDLLTAQRVPKTTATRHGKRRALTTHERIEVLRSRHPEAADALEAVKWIGNQASHDVNLRVADALDGADLLARAIELLYIDRPRRLRRLAKQLIERKGITPTR
jgi:hypothetical protein